MSDTTMRPDFVDVYDEQLGPLWRFVRSRVPDPYAAEDLTAEVFSRAWKGWGRFDPERGNAAAWLFGIAHNVVADWWRHRPAEVAMEDPHEPDPSRAHDGTGAPADPADQPLRREATERVAAAVAGLSQRDRDALALRYGGGLAVADVAAVLEVSLSAAKMTISRALERLRTIVAVDDADVGAHDLAPTLSSLLDDTRSRLTDAERDPALLELVAHLAVVHDHEVPEELPGRIAACIGCREYEHLLRDGDRRRGRRRERPAVLASIWLLLGVTCMVCTLPVLWPLLSAVGLTLATQIGHDLGLAAAPVVFWIVRRQSRRHGDRVPQWLAGVGMSLLLVHVALHFSPDNTLPDGGSDYVAAVWTFADRAGSGLLLVGVLAHWRSLENWLRAQRSALVERIMAERHPSAPLRAPGR